MLSFFRLFLFFCFCLLPIFAAAEEPTSPSSEEPTSPSSEEPTPASSEEPAPVSSEEPDEESVEKDASDKTKIDGIEALGEVRSDGSLHYAIPFDVPKYRGLEPKLGVTYNSSFTGRGKEEVWLGAGWALKGLSVIDRVTLGNGVPTFNDSRDIYRLDGAILMACADSDATNPFDFTTHDYPDRYRTDTASASCRAGGNMATMVDNYNRVNLLYETIGSVSVPYFQVNTKDGTTYEYQSIGVLSGVAADQSSVDFELLFQRKFLLTEVRNTQATPSIVNYEYRFGSSENGMAYAPLRITYAGYKVEFHYQWTPIDEPLATYAIGHETILGKQRHKLRAITMHSGTDKIRAYAVDYTQSAMTGTSLVSGIRAYGSTFVQNGWEISGDKLPDPISGLVYNSDTVSFTEQVFPGQKFHRELRIYDEVGNGKDTVQFLKRAQWGLAQSCVYSTVTDSAKRLNINAAGGGPRTIANANDPGHPVFSAVEARVDPTALCARATSGGLEHVRLFEGLSGIVPSWGKSAVFTQEFDWYGGGGEAPYWPHDYVFRWHQQNPDLLDTGSRDTGSAKSTFSFGNYDDDPELEVYRVPGGGHNERLYDFDGTTLTEKEVLMINHSTLLHLDMNGDSVIDKVVTAAEHMPWQIQRFFDGVSQPLQMLDSSVRRNNVNVAAADVNGDGNDDLIMLRRRSHSSEAIWVALSTGNGFQEGTKWLDMGDCDSGGLASLCALYDHVGEIGETWGQITSRDVNGDGLEDIIVHTGHLQGMYCATATPEPGCLQLTEEPFGSQPAYVFLSNGHGFVPETSANIAPIPGYIGMGDFDGNGLPDALIESETDGRIWFGDGDVANRLVQLQTSLGASLSVEYAPSTEFQSTFANPGVTQVVAAIERSDGRGQVRRSEYSYSGARYDYNNRRSLGFSEVQVKLPRVADETSDLMLVTEYQNSHIAEVGLIDREYLKYGASIWQDTQNTWSVNKNGNGPYSASKTQVKSGKRHGDRVIYKTKTFSYSPYNDIVREGDLGFDGSQDDVSSLTGYQFNLTDYIVNKPSYKIVGKGSAINYSATDRSDKWLRVEWYTYDNNGGPWSAPSRGNLASVQQWDGNTSSSTSRVVETHIYDSHGNITRSIGAIRNQITDYTYTGPDNLFEASVTNAKGHQSTTTWDYGCQAPVTVTDPNGLVTTFTYDAYCRETQKRLAWGTAWSQMQDFRTRYLNFGNASAQYVETYQKSSNVTSGQEWQYSRKYFDGLGQIYKETAPGAVSSISASSVVLRSFDLRGQKAWESIPISWADSTDNDADPNTQRVSYKYDPVGRVTNETMADGAYRTVRYSNWERTVQGQTTYFPQAYSKGFDCNNGSPLICDERLAAFDADGNMVFMWNYDRAHSDVTSVTHPYRRHTFEYDLLNQLTRVVDAEGLTFTYKYDAFGNKIEQSDPGLGRWSLEYNADNTLKKQIDAKGQEIEFWYDELGRQTVKRVKRRDGNGALLSTDYSFACYDGGTHSWGADKCNAVSGYTTGRLTWQSQLQHTTAWTYLHHIENQYDMAGNITLQKNIVNLPGSGTRTFVWEASYTVAGDLLKQTYLSNPGGTGRTWTPDITYDTANRVVSFGNYITNTSYNEWGSLVERVFGSGARTVNHYHAQRGWVLQNQHFDRTGTSTAYAVYSKSPSGRVIQLNSINSTGKLGYTYDGAGRLLTAMVWNGSTWGQSVADQTFTYDRAGRMRTNSKLGNYTYPSATSVGADGKSIYAHAPSSLTHTADPTLGTETFTYDANGNMLTGLKGKVMTYDGENRPLSVTYNNETTAYVYGADGSRIKKIEKYNTGNQTETVYINGTEIRNFDSIGGSEKMLTHLAEEVRITHTSPTGTGRLDYLHSDQLGSIITISGGGQSDRDGLLAERRTYHPFGKISYQYQASATLTEETKGFIGERYDADAGLQFLNARYYDPELALFIPQDRFDPRKTEMGANR